MNEQEHPASQAGRASRATGVGVRHEAVANALEGARIEVVKRLTDRGLPLSLQTQQLELVAAEGGRGWRTQWAPLSISGLHSRDVQMAIRDDSVEYAVLGLRPQLEALAQLLEATTDLGTRPANFLPGASGVEAILARYVSRLALTYLIGLRTLEVADPEAVMHLADELDELIEQQTIRHTRQLAIEGIVVSSPIEHRDVKLRPLTPAERGQYWLSRGEQQLNPPVPQTDFVVPHEAIVITPSVLLEATTARKRSELVDQSTLLNRIALAFYLRGFDIASTGVAVGFDRPMWATLGQAHGRALVDEKPILGVKPLSLAEFQGLVDLAYKMPDFGPGEASNREVALYRALRGLGMHWAESGFLDYVIALEAALLPGVSTELSYRFALYGALFLKDERNPVVTFDQLKNIYDVRSGLVHGSKVDFKKRERATMDVPDIVKAVIYKAVAQGWPDRQQLNRSALDRLH